MTDEPVLAIGVDGGASGVRALAVRRRADGLLEAAGAIARREHVAFRAVDLATQRAEAADPRLRDVEAAVARTRVSATADAIAEAAGGSSRIALGICWPGLKSADGRGVVVMRNGPRDPALLDELERELAARGVGLAAPIPRLASDGVAGALGERWASAGSLRDVTNALYFAGGSGLAEALLVAGRVRALDELTPPMPKAFELRVPPPQLMLEHLDRVLTVYEDLLSPGRWTPPAADARREDGAASRDAGRARDPDGAGSDAHRRRDLYTASADPNRLRTLGAARGHVDPAITTDWALALQYDPRRTTRTLRGAADALVRYIRDRMQRLSDSVGVVPECAVVGARFGQLIALPEAREVLHERIVGHLQAAGLPDDFVRASTFLEAPCFGAAALALGLEDEACPS